MRRFIWLFLWFVLLGIVVIIGVDVGIYANENLIQPWAREIVVIIIAGAISLLGHGIAFICLALFFVDKSRICASYKYDNDAHSESTC